MEYWKPVLGYEGFYEVSSLGRIKSVDRYVKAKIKNNELVLRKGKILKLRLKRSGYYSIDASKENKVKTIPVHKIVAVAFIPNPDEKPCINHKNAIKTDNRVENLEWVTHKENSQHASMMNLFPTPQKVKIECSNGMYFVSSVEAAKWLNENKFDGTKSIKTVSKNIRRACTGNSNVAYGYRWKDLIEKAQRLVL